MQMMAMGTSTRTWSLSLYNDHQNHALPAPQQLSMPTRNPIGVGELSTREHTPVAGKAPVVLRPPLVIKYGVASLGSTKHAWEYQACMGSTKYVPLLGVG